MINNPAAAMRALITYAMCIPVAILVGYLLTDQFTYGSLGILGLIILFVFSPIFIKWHYPIMIFSLACPMYLFFLKGNPTIGQAMVCLSLGIAIVERALNSDRKFLRAPIMTWALIYTLVVVCITMKMTGGFGLHTFGSEIGGGKKYMVIFIGIATFFAITSRAIPKKHCNLYLGLFFLSSLPAFISDLFPVLPTPLTYINLLFPPSVSAQNLEIGTTRLGAFSQSASCVIYFMLARFGLRGIFLEGKILRIIIFFLMWILTMLGGFRLVLGTFLITFALLFFFEKLYRTKLLLIFTIIGIIAGSLIVPFANKLPFTFQRALSFLPVNVDQEAKLSAEGSTEWRYKMWQDLWPKVPQYLWLGKGYALSPEDYEMIGNGMFANSDAAKLDASEISLAVSGDYHNGPLSALMPFGIWGAIAILWIMIAALRIIYLNFKYGDSNLKTVNTVLFVMMIVSFINYLFIFGAFPDDIGGFARITGFNIALNGGIRGVKLFSQPQPA